MILAAGFEDRLRSRYDVFGELNHLRVDGEVKKMLSMVTDKGWFDFIMVEKLNAVEGGE